MNVVFLGTPRAAVPTLEALLADGHRVSLVVTQPDRPAGRSERPIPPPIKISAERHGIPVFQPLRVRGPEFADAIAREEADALVTVAYGRILPEPALNAAPFGAINVHFSLLPRYRGAAPVQWALAKGDNATGVTTIQMNERMDEGDILLQETVPIEPDEHAPHLQDRLAVAGASLLLRTIAGLAAATILPQPQDAARVSYAPLLTRADGEADFKMAARAIEGRLRGFDPWPGVWTQNRGRRIRIREGRAALSANVPSPPGTVFGFERGAFLVACGDNSVLEVVAVQPESGRTLSATEARNGRIVTPGDRFAATAPTT